MEYNIKEHLIYGNQRMWKKIIEWIITIIAWLVILSYAGYLIYGAFAIRFGWFLPEFAIYNRSMVIEIGRYFYILLIAALIVAAMLIIWKNYNLRRFGKLKRRKFRKPVSNEELAEMFKVDKNMIDSIQKSRVVVLEYNIIPEGLGMGRERKKSGKYSDKN